jgi:hypothetical protein
MRICSRHRFAQRPASARTAAAALCAAFIAAFILSSGFIFSHADHTHDHHGAGGSCATCAHLVAAEKLLNAVSVTAVCAALALGFLPIRSAALKPALRRMGFSTLIRLKVRLNY